MIINADIKMTLKTNKKRGNDDCKVTRRLENFSYPKCGYMLVREINIYKDYIHTECSCLMWSRGGKTCLFSKFDLIDMFIDVGLNGSSVQFVSLVIHSLLWGLSDSFKEISNTPLWTLHIFVDTAQRNKNI